MTVGRIPPQSEEAEMAVLGSMLLDRDAIPSVVETLRPADFYRDTHRVIFTSMADLFERNEPVDLVTVTEALRASGKLDTVGGPMYLASLPGVVATAANVDYYADIVHKKSLLRALISAGTHIARLGYDEDADATELVAQAEQLVFQIAGKRDADLALMPEIVRETMDHIAAGMDLPAGEMPGVPYPQTLAVLNDSTGGQYPGEVIVVQARSGDGKSVLLMQSAVEAASRRGWGLLCSNEMERTDYGRRLLSAAANVDGLVIRRGKTSQDEWTRISRAVGPTSETRLAIKHHCESFLQIRAAAHQFNAQMRSEGGIKWLGVDWIQLLSYGSGRWNTDTQELDAIMKGLKRLASELQIPVMIASQPAKADYREGLTLASGRGSGMIGNIAHTVFSIESWNGEGRVIPSGYIGWPTKIRIDKARNGVGKGQAEQEAWYDAPRTRFFGLDEWIRSKQGPARYQPGA